MITLYVVTILTLLYLTHKEKMEHGDLDILNRDPSFRRIGIFVTFILTIFGFIVIMYLP